MSHRRGQPRGQSHLQVSFESEQSWDQDENLCDVLEGPPVLLATGRAVIRLRIFPGCYYLAPRADTARAGKFPTTLIIPLKLGRMEQHQCWWGGSNTETGRTLQHRQH